MIRTENDITPAVARSLRKSLGLSQETFWGAIGVGQATGCNIERGRSPICKPYQRLIFLLHVARLNFDTTSVAGATEARAAGAMWHETQALKQHTEGENGITK